MCPVTFSLAGVGGRVVPTVKEKCCFVLPVGGQRLSGFQIILLLMRVWLWMHLWVSVCYECVSVCVSICGMSLCLCVCLGLCVCVSV